MAKRKDLLYFPINLIRVITTKNPLRVYEFLYECTSERRKLWPDLMLFMWILRKRLKILNGEVRQAPHGESPLHGDS